MPAPLPEISLPVGIATLLRDLIHERIGIYFEDSRLGMMIDKLSGRAAARGCRSYLDYYYILKYDEHLADEWLRVMDAFSVQETYFYREFSQIHVLVNTLIPAWFQKTSEPFKIWSAACASGEEPYSLAIAIREAGLRHLPIEIVASDASELALSRAQSAIYRERSFRSFPEALRRRYFSETPEGWQLQREELLPISFKRVNLASSEDIAQIGETRVIFCRNVFIYFSSSAIERTVSAFSLQMPFDGTLFIGASESLLKMRTPFELKEMGDAFAYVRKPREDKKS